MIVISIIFIMLILILLFLYSALKISSLCYDEEEWEEINEQFEEDFYE